MKQLPEFPQSYWTSSVRLPEFPPLTSDTEADVVIVGAMSHMCIDATTRAAADHGYRVTVVADACATRDSEFDGRLVPAADVHAAFMSALAFAYAEVKKTDEVHFD